MTAANANLWTLKKARTRDDLVRAALRLFRRQGFEKTTVEEIAAAARCSPRTFFRYFGSKEDLVFHDLPDHLGFMRDRLVESLARGPVWDAVVDAITAVVTRFLSAGAELAGERFEAWLREPALRQRFAVLCLEFEAGIADAIAASRNTRADADSYARIVAIAGVASVRSAIESPSRRGFVEQLKSLLDGIGDGLRHEPEPQRSNRAPLARTARRQTT